MKFPIVKGFGLLTLIVLITSLGTVGLGAMKSAWADPGISCLPSSLSVEAGGSLAYTCWGDPGSSPNFAGVTALFRTTDETGAPDSFLIFPPGVSSCTGLGYSFGGPGGADLVQSIYIVGDGSSTDTYSLYTIPDSTSGPTLPPTPGSEDSITWTYPAPVFSTTSDASPPGPSTTGTPTWEPLGLSGPLGPLTVGTWVFTSCAIDTSSPVSNVKSNSITVTKPVAGEILSIDTTALLLAGAQQNGIWVLSSLAIVAGASFALLRFQIYTKSK